MAAFRADNTSGAFLIAPNVAPTVLQPKSTTTPTSVFSLMNYYAL